MVDKHSQAKASAKPGGFIGPGEMLWADMQRRTEQLRHELGPIMFDAQNSIDEESFVRYFLPLFAGDYGSDKAKFTEAVQAWFRVAGNPFTAVNVMANGQMVAVVPPVRSNILSGKPTDNIKDVGAILDDAAHFATLNPGAAQTLIVTSLHQRYMTNIPRPDLTREQRAWFELLNRYGRAPKGWSVAQVQGSSTSTDSTDDDFDYECE